MSKDTCTVVADKYGSRTHTGQQHNKVKRQYRRMVVGEREERESVCVEVSYDKGRSASYNLKIMIMCVFLIYT